MIDISKTDTETNIYYYAEAAITLYIILKRFTILILYTYRNDSVKY